MKGEAIIGANAVSYTHLDVYKRQGMDSAEAGEVFQKLQDDGVEADVYKRQAFMRVTIKNMLSKNGFEVVGEAENGLVAIQKCVECQPDIVTMDITMPEVSGLDALKEIMKVRPETNVVMVSALGQEAMVRCV